MHVSGKIESPFPAAGADSPRSADWSWRLELKCCERKILLGWLELELMAGVV